MLGSWVPEGTPSQTRNIGRARRALVPARRARTGAEQARRNTFQKINVCLPSPNVIRLYVAVLKCHARDHLKLSNWFFHIGLLGLHLFHVGLLGPRFLKAYMAWSFYFAIAAKVCACIAAVDFLAMLLGLRERKREKAGPRRLDTWLAWNRSSSKGWRQLHQMQQLTQAALPLFRQIGLTCAIAYIQRPSRHFWRVSQQRCRSEWQNDGSQFNVCQQLASVLEKQ